MKTTQVVSRLLLTGLLVIAAGNVSADCGCNKDKLPDQDQSSSADQPSANRSGVKNKLPDQNKSSADCGCNKDKIPEQDKYFSDASSYRHGNIKPILLAQNTITTMPPGAVSVPQNTVTISRPAKVVVTKRPVVVRKQTIVVRKHPIKFSRTTVVVRKKVLLPRFRQIMVHRKYYQMLPSKRPVALAQNCFAHPHCFTPPPAPYRPYHVGRCKCRYWMYHRHHHRVRYLMPRDNCSRYGFCLDSQDL